MLIYTHVQELLPNKTFGIHYALNVNLLIKIMKIKVEININKE